MRCLKLSTHDFCEQTEAWMDTAATGNVICVEKKDGRRVYIISDLHWPLIVKALEQLLIHTRQ